MGNNATDKCSIYYNLPYLDAVHQTYTKNSLVNRVKGPLRNAVNGCRVSTEGMIELKALLKDTADFIEQIEQPKRKKAVRRKKNVEEYQLP